MIKDVVFNKRTIILLLFQTIKIYCYPKIKGGSSYKGGDTTVISKSRCIQSY